MDPEEKKKLIDKRKQTCLKKYGVENAMKSEELRNKYKQSVLQKYGTDSFSKTKAFKEKVSDTWKNKTENEKQVMVSKCKQTCLKRYGVTNGAKTDKAKEKYRQTCLEKYGVACTFQWEPQKEKTKQTNLKKYGSDNVARNEKVRNKYKETMLKTYGVEYSMQSKEIRDKAVKRYLYENQHFDSSWELAVWIWANDLGKHIEKEPFGIEYEHDGKTHIYFPDFKIDDVLIEIKGDQFFAEDGTMQNPFDHTKDEIMEVKIQCGLQHGVQIWAKKEMKPILNYIKTKYGTQYLNQFRNIEKDEGN